MNLVTIIIEIFVLIPSSAHGTNPASAVMAGMKVMVTKSTEEGNIDVDDLREKAELHKDNLSAFNGNLSFYAWCL